MQNARHSGFHSCESVRRVSGDMPTTEFMEGINRQLPEPVAVHDFDRHKWMYVGQREQERR